MAHPRNSARAAAVIHFDVVEFSARMTVDPSRLQDETGLLAATSLGRRLIAPSFFEFRLGE